MKLVAPDANYLPEYLDALERGWSPLILRPQGRDEQLARIATDPKGFLATFEDREAKAGPVTLPDGTKVRRLPSIGRWIWQDGFCGTISFRWMVGTEDLPPTCLGHIGYNVVPWRRPEGLASAALLAMLPEVKSVGLRYVDITTDPENAASLGVIRRAGGVFVRRFQKPLETGGGEGLLFRVHLPSC